MWWVEGRTGPAFQTFTSSKSVGRLQPTTHPPTAHDYNQYAWSAELTRDHGVSISRRIHGDGGGSDSGFGWSRRRVSGIFHGFSTTDGPAAAELQALGGLAGGAVNLSTKNFAKHCGNGKKKFGKLRATLTRGAGREKRFYETRGAARTTTGETSTDRGGPANGCGGGETALPDRFRRGRSSLAVVPRIMVGYCDGGVRYNNITADAVSSPLLLAKSSTRAHRGVYPPKFSSVVTQNTCCWSV